MARGKASSTHARAPGRAGGARSGGGTTRHADRQSTNGSRGHATPADPTLLTLEDGESTVDQLLDLQRSAGNSAVTSLVAQVVPVQRQAVAYASDESAPAGPRPNPADLDVGFNPMDRSHRLREAIDQSDYTIKKQPAIAPGQIGQFRGPEVVRHVDFPAVVAALSNLTAVQIEMIDAEYKAAHKRPLRYDLLGGGASGVPTDLTEDQIKRVSALLAGTRAAPGEDPELARLNQLDADAAELHEILSRKRSDAGVERVMAILRSHADRGGITSAYDRLYKTSLGKALGKLGLQNALRAGMLLVGSPIAADAIKVAGQRQRIAEIDARLNQFDPSVLSMPSIGPGRQLYDELRKLRDERKKIVADIIATLEMASEEARELAEDPALADAEARQRVAQVAGGDVDALAADVGGGRGQAYADAAVVRAIAATDAGRKSAGQLRQLHVAGKLTPTAVADALRGLREFAATEAQRLNPLGDELALALAERELLDRYFAQLRSTWDADPDGPRFDDILGKGGKIEAERNRALAKGLGQIDPVDELIYALSGERKDLETVKRVLRDKHADEIANLKVQYFVRTHRTLDFDLFGEAPTKAGQANPAIVSQGRLVYLKPQGKSSGVNRLVLEDYFQRAQREGGWEEIVYLSERAEREYQYTIDNRGLTGWWRDKWGNEAKQLLDETIREVRSIRKQYGELVIPARTPPMVLKPEQADTPLARGLLLRMRHARATIRGDREGYEKATAALREKFQAAAAFVIQMALSAVLGPAVSALIRLRGLTLGMSLARWARNTSVSIAATMGSNYVVYGNDYGWERIKKDVVSGLAGSLGNAAAEAMVPRIAYGLSQQLGSKLNPEITKMAGTYASTSFQEIAEGNSPLVSMDRFVQEHLMGKAQDYGTGKIQKGLGIDADGGETGTKDGDEGSAGTRRASGSTASDGTPATEPTSDAPARDAPDVDTAVDAPDAPVSMRLPEPGGPTPGDKSRRGGADRDPGDPAMDPGDVTRIGRPPPPPETDFSPNVPDTPRVRANREAQARRAAEHPRDIPTIQQATRPDARARARAAEFAPLYGEWPTLSPERRRARIEEIVNVHLRDTGIPHLRVEPAPLRAGGGYLDFETGRLHVSAVDLVTADVTPERFAGIVDAAVHEARHALHYFRGVRAAMQEGTFDIAADIPGDWVAAARAANDGTRAAEPLMRLSPKYQEGLAIYEHTHGAGADARRKVIRRRDSTKREYLQAVARRNKLRKGTAEYARADSQMNRAYDAYIRAHNAYVALPEEIDAWRMGSGTAKAVVERLNLEHQITRAEVASVAAEQRYREVETRYERLRAEIALKPGHHLSLELQREYRRARNKWLATQKKLELLRKQLAALHPA